jgi:prepilin-type N-terminal cleavage/methylation domain-containing protein
MRQHRNKGFTLVELLVSIAVIAILAGMLLVGVRRARFSARMAECKSNLKQFSGAVDMYRGNLDDFPDFVSNLYSAYIDTDEIYLCPADRSDPKGSEGGKPPHEPDPLQYAETDDNLNNISYVKMRNADIQYCSYLYEFCGAVCSWINPNPDNITWKQMKILEVERGSILESGDVATVYGHVPLVRCFWHIEPDVENEGYKDEKMVINVAVEDRNIFMSGPAADDWKKQF